MGDMRTPETILKSTFGYDTFLPYQQEVISNVLAGRDTLAILPTGGGKSLCYQIPALLLEGLAVVVSPLISLMKDQVEQLRAYGVPAVFLNSSLSLEEYHANMRMVQNGKVRLLYVAPETLLTPRIQALLQTVKVSLLTIDEAHCISEWGHDFRPEYRQMAEVRRLFPQAACLALTATATDRVRADIRHTLDFSSKNEFVASFDRRNLYLAVVSKNGIQRQILEKLQDYRDQSGIIYCFSRRQVDKLAADLISHGHSALPYHAGLSDMERRRNQDAFIRDDVQIIVATVAFGMGINKPNVRFVFHCDLPKSIEGYYQEIGRAGRDGLPAECILFYSYADVAKIHYFIDQKEGSEKQTAITHLNALVQYAENAAVCRRKQILGYFGESSEWNDCGNCDVCLSKTVETLTDLTVPAQKFLLGIHRSGERFGAGHIADILLGSKNQKVLRWQHDQLSVYGKGEELTRKQWMHLARQLLAMGYIQQSSEYRTLSLTPRGVEVLRNEVRVMGVLQEAGSPEKRAAVTQSVGADQQLFNLLRQKRKEIADAQNIPPYVVFPDKTLIEMAAHQPQNAAEMIGIYGVGEVKLRRYGKAFIQVIVNYRRLQQDADQGVLHGT
ncbi:MAG: DNA helicase RecQ [Anaerolineae bacterium]|nr:DNA helicase RecQ [Anaerolineae bacterium]